MAMLGRFSLNKSSPLDGVGGTAVEVVERSDTHYASDDADKTDESIKVEQFQRKILDAKVRLHRRLIDEINLGALDKASPAELRKLVRGGTRTRIFCHKPF